MPLWHEQVVACGLSLSKVFSGCAKLLLVKSGSPDLFNVTISLDYARIFLRTCSIGSFDIFCRPDTFLLHKQASSLHFLWHVQICIAVGDCFENSLTNACCTVLFDCDLAYYNTQNTFKLPVKGISICVKIKASNIKHEILTCLKTCCQNEKKFERKFT